jgi:prepilin-type processing-associated H-X9-DG protein
MSPDPMPRGLLQSAPGGDPFDPSCAPETIVLARDRGRLRLVWPGGAEGEIDATRLRAACRCAWCTRARVEGTFPATFDGAAIERLAPIGDYAINICFTDGHARGIFPWQFLRALAAGHAAPPAIDTTSSAAPGATHHDGPSP